jgi:hypothetical protein
MQQRRKITIALTLLIPAFLWATRYRTSEFKGGISIADSGLFYYPEYHAQIGYVELDKPGEYRFTLHGLPQEHMWLQFDVMGATLSDEPELRSLSTSLNTTLLDASGNPVCSASGQLSDKWRLSVSADHASFWNRGCAPSNDSFDGFPVSRSTTYTLTVKVDHVNPHSPKLVAIPVLKGGGIELP